MAADLDLKVDVVGVPTMREKHGLAMSSRNAHLDAGERGIAPTLYRVLRDCAARIAADEAIARVVAEGWNEIEAPGFAVDYLKARNAETLARAKTPADGPLRLLVAAHLGKTRLIDNVAV
jgi:pantoate--beta-alanine ligase